MSRVALSARFDKKGLQIGSGTQLRTNAPSPQKREDANPLKNCNVLAVEAVIGEPVSVSEFPVSRENTGKFAT